MLHLPFVPSYALEGEDHEAWHNKFLRPTFCWECEFGDIAAFCIHERRLRPSLLMRDYAVHNLDATAGESDFPELGFIRNCINYAPPVACLDPQETVLPSSHPFQCSTASFDAIPPVYSDSMTMVTPSTPPTRRNRPRMARPKRQQSLRNPPPSSSSLSFSTPEPELVGNQNPALNGSNAFLSQYTDDDVLVEPRRPALRRRTGRYHPYQKFEKLADLYSLPQPVLWSEVDQGVPAEIATVIASHGEKLLKCRSISSDEGADTSTSEDVGRMDTEEEDWVTVERPLIVRLKGRYWKEKPSNTAPMDTELDDTILKSQVQMGTPRSSEPMNALRLTLHDTDGRMPLLQVFQSNNATIHSLPPVTTYRTSTVGRPSPWRIRIRNSKAPSKKSSVVRPRSQEQVDALPPVSSLEESIWMETSSASSAASSPSRIQTN
ncbi:hypothetical protein FRB91_010907 [Serendipita sp. 411]|nr:hypothetical protein FRB91_010907 [Serendipita sp. 411]